MKLLRVASTDYATYGLLCDDDGVPFLCCLELPWLDNHPETSCIPVGAYRCQRYESPRHGSTFEITGVPGRTNIELHVGNTPTDLLGCVAVAQSFGTVNGQPGVTNSRAGFADFLARTATMDAFTLTVVQV